MPPSCNCDFQLHAIIGIISQILKHNLVAAGRVKPGCKGSSQRPPFRPAI